MANNGIGLYWDDIEVGDKYETAHRTISEADLVMFAGLTGDYNRLHTDEEYAKTTIFGGRIAHGALTYSYATGLHNRLRRYEGTVVANAMAEVKYTAPVMIGDTIHCEVTVTEKKASKQKADRGLATHHMEVKNQKGVVVCTIEGSYMLYKRPQ